MCGITGIVALPPASGATAGPAHDPPRLRAMCDALVHRGPDEEGTDLQGGVALGMRRLSIIDVAGGHQPYANEDGRVRSVFNGEIYNFRELRRELEAKGHRFASATDGEVVVHLWEEHGADFPRRLNGMFAIALHDAARGRLLLVRDRLGIKPLYYAFAGGHLVFGSEIKALLASGLVEPALDLDGLGQFLSWEYIPEPGTLLRGVRKLGAACTLEVDLGTGRSGVMRYWDVPLPEPHANGGLPRTDGEWEEAVDAQLRRSVQAQLVSDVPLGAFLSGGVDSSLVVAGMGPHARTFSIGFDDPSYNELAWSQRVARHLGVDHRVEIIRPDVGGLFDHLMHFMDDPIGDFSIFPTFLVSRLARREVTVALSGDGGDEVFGGYETYVAQARARALARVPAFVWSGVAEPAMARVRPRSAKKGVVNKAKRFVEGMGQPPELGHARWRVFVDEALRRELFTREARTAMRTPVGGHVLRLFDEAGHRPDVDRGLYVDLKSYLSDNCLVKTDRMSMACSLEARVPFLDHELVELAFRMPARLKVAGGRTKVLLKRVAARHVPEACVYRPKEGFSIPIKNWLGSEFRPLLEDLLSRDRVKGDGIFQPETVERLKVEHLTGRSNHSHVLWSLLVFQDWRRRWSVA
ncbi:MAG: asparagine synthase (glutamine-hydrolyzing) [Gemmatimonadetes bacterium]|nr:asparagine synthase (glutamine-hydrolyzing) [Gemmatimonadota bacterium]